MSPGFLNTLEVIINGLMAGVMYSLVALGFVLIFKASGIFNYAQGVMALFAAATLVGFQNGQVPFSHLINAVFGTQLHHFGWHLPVIVSILLTIVVMIIFAFLVERLILKHLVNQEPIILFMATIGLAYFMEGFGDLMWGSEIKTMDVGLPEGGSLALEAHTVKWAAEGSDYYGMYLDKLDIVAAIVAIALVISLTLFTGGIVCWYQLAQDLGDHVVHCGLCRHGCRHHVGFQVRGAIFIVFDCT